MHSRDGCNSWFQHAVRESLNSNCLRTCNSILSTFSAAREFPHIRIVPNALSYFSWKMSDRYDRYKL